MIQITKIKKMTKQEILTKNANDNSYNDWGEYMYDSHEHTQIEAACEVMDTFAKIVAIAFFKWTESNLDEDGMYNGEMKTDDELFHLFTQSKEYKELMNS